MAQHLDANKNSISISAFESESRESYDKRATRSKEQSETRRLLESNYNSTKYCCCSMSKGLIIWNTFMLFFNIITNGLFITIIILTYSQYQYELLISYVITQILLRFLMNVMGFKSVKHIFSKDELYRNNNFLFLFGVSSILTTIIFDAVFLVYFNYILYHISNGSITGVISDNLWVDHDLEMIKLVWFNLIWIVDILIVLFSVRTYFRYITIDMTSEYYRYKIKFWILIILCMVMLFWGIFSSIVTMTGNAVNVFK